MPADNGKGRAYDMVADSDNDSYSEGSTTDIDNHDNSADSPPSNPDNAPPIVCDYNRNPEGRNQWGGICEY